jgi:hypothetical protein
MSFMSSEATRLHSEAVSYSESLKQDNEIRTDLLARGINLLLADQSAE